MKVLFCDDDLEMLKQLENDFKVYFKDKIIELETKCLYQKFNDLQKYDICFLDIDLKSEDGIALAKKLKIYNPQLIIIFISQREDLVFQTFSVQPFQFIRKKHYQEDLKEVFNQLNYSLQQTAMTLNINHQKIYINPLDILSVISLDHDVIITTKEKTYTLKDSLKNFCQENEKYFIIQIKKNLAISLYQVKNVKGNKITYEKYDAKGNEIYQDIDYIIAVNQTLTVNTNASDVFNADIGRDVDEMINAVKAAIDANDKVDKIKDMMNQAAYSGVSAQENLQTWLEAAQKEADYANDNLQKLYDSYIGNFDEYLSDVNLAITTVGSKGDRLELTETRMSNQQLTVKTLKSNNEDRELSDIIIDYTAAYTAYQASLRAAGMLNQTTLLNYI